MYAFGYYYLADLIEGFGTPLTVGLIAIAVAVALAIVLLIGRNLAAWEGRAEQALPGPLFGRPG